MSPRSSTYPPPFGQPAAPYAAMPAHAPPHLQPAEQPTFRAPAGPGPQPQDGPQDGSQGGQPFPSGELLVPPHGTPPGTLPSPEMSLPAHLIGFPSGQYGQAPPGWGEWTSPVARRRQKLPAWVLPVVFTLAIGLATGITIALARAFGG